MVAHRGVPGSANEEEVSEVDRIAIYYIVENMPEGLERKRRRVIGTRQWL